MVNLLVSRYTLKRATFSVLAVCLMLCSYYVFYLHRRRIRLHSYKENDILKNKTYIKYCPLVQSFTADIDTNEIFQSFQLQVSKMMI